MSLVFRKMNVLTKEKHAASYNKGVRAYADITLNGVVEVNGFSIREGTKGLWVSFPSVRSGTGENAKYYPTFRFAKAEDNASLAEDIIAHFKAVKAGEVKKEEHTPAY